MPVYTVPNKGEPWMCDEPCEHHDRAKLRAWFESTCKVCGQKPVEGEVYMWLNKEEWIHVRCIPDGPADY